MESNNINRISATGLKSVEIDELTTDQIIINNEGLQYLHKYNILLPTMTEGFYNLQDELDNIMISNTSQDVELIQLQSGMIKVKSDIVDLGTLAGTANINALGAIDLANQKSWILFFQKPLRSDISNNVYLDIESGAGRCDPLCLPLRARRLRVTHSSAPPPACLRSASPARGGYLALWSPCFAHSSMTTQIPAAGGVQIY